MSRLIDRAKRHFVGGVNSPVRSFDYVGGDPIIADRGRGARIYDRAGKGYIDYTLSFGALILGHAHPGVLRDTRRIIKKGLHFGTTTAIEVELAERIKKAVPGMERIRFVNSGTEAVMGAIRLARGYTARDKVVKFADSYHGHADYLLAKAGSGLASLNIPLSRGVPADFFKHTIISRYGDKNGIDRVFAKYGRGIAAVVVEPAGGNFGVRPPDTDFLRYLRQVSREHKALLIFDEVITGFRFSYGSLGDKLGVEADLTVLGKIIGGGLPVGAYGGSGRIMRCLAPAGEVYQASTFAGNPVVMQAGATTLKNLSGLKKKYDSLAARVSALCVFIRDEAGKRRLRLELSSYGTMFSFKFGEREQFKRFFWGLVSRGIYIAPSEFEANFISFAHTDNDIGKTRDAVKNVLRSMGRRRG